MKTGEGTSLSLGAVLEGLEQRELVLASSADLYAEIHAFMETVTARTYADYDAAKGYANCEALRIKYITAMAIRDDYRSTAKENRDDVALMASVRHFSLKASSPDREAGA